MGEVRETLLLGEGGKKKIIILSEGSQASPACPSDTGSLEAKTLVS
jgi:hypothetical protein